MLGLLALNKLTPTDIAFFIALGVIIVIAIAIYFLIPVFNKKQYKEQRENLKKREAAFKSNVKRTDGAVAEEQTDGVRPVAEQTPDSAAAQAPADGQGSDGETAD